MYSFVYGGIAGAVMALCGFKIWNGSGINWINLIALFLIGVIIFSIDNRIENLKDKN